MTRKAGQGRVPTAHSAAPPPPAETASEQVAVTEERAHAPSVAATPPPAPESLVVVGAVVKELRKLAAVIDNTNPNINPIQFMVKDDWRKVVKACAEALEERVLRPPDAGREEIRKAG